MGKSLIIPGADFSQVAIPYIAKVTIAPNQTAVIYSGNNNVFATIQASEKERTIDLTDILSVDDPALFDFTFAREQSVFKKVWVNVDFATTLRDLLVNVSGTSSVLNEVFFSGSTETAMNIEGILMGQDKLESIDLSCIHAALTTANNAFNECKKVKSINLQNVTTLGIWTNMFRYCSDLEVIDFSSLEEITSMPTLAIGTGPFLYCTKIERIKCPELSVTDAMKFIKQLSAGPNILGKHDGTDIVKVDLSEHWTYTSGAPNPSTMTLWDSNVWDNPVIGTTYYVDATLNRLYTYNG